MEHYLFPLAKSAQKPCTTNPFQLQILCFYTDQKSLAGCDGYTTLALTNKKSP